MNQQIEQIEKKINELNNQDDQLIQIICKNGDLRQDIESQRIKLRADLQKLLVMKAVNEATNNIIYIKDLLKLILQYFIDFACEIQLSGAMIVLSNIKEYYYYPFDCNLFNTKNYTHVLHTKNKICQRKKLDDSIYVIIRLSFFNNSYDAIYVRTFKKDPNINFRYNSKTNSDVINCWLRDDNTTLQLDFHFCDNILDF